jgi:transcriptional regulator with XRE-family HTH domain
MEQWSKMKKSTLVESLKTSVGKAIATERARRQLTQEELARSIGVEGETISRFERGSTLPSLARLAEIAEVLDVPTFELVRAGTIRRTDIGADISLMLQDLKPEDQQWVRDWVAQISDKLSRR